MKFLIFYAIGQSLLLLFLLKDDENDGEKELFRQQTWKASDVVIVILSINILKLLLYYLPAIPFVSHSIYQLFLKKNPHITHSLILLSVVSILLIMLFRFRIKQDISELGFRKQHFGRNVKVGLIVGFAMSIVSITIDLTMGPDSSAKEIVREMGNLSGFSEYALYFFTVVILGPAVEESIYRGVLYSPYRKKYGPTKAIIITSLFFAIIHLKVGFGFTFLSGIAYGLLYERTESIITPIGAHCLFNLIGTLSVLYPEA